MSAATDLGKVAIGDRLLMVTETERHREPKDEPKLVWLTVTKVGRVYGEAQRDGTKAPWGEVRFTLKTGSTGESYRSTISRVYRSEEAWRAVRDADNAWAAFRRSADSYTRPAGASAEDIKAAAALLKLDPDWNRK